MRTKDVELIQRVLTGDDAAFSELVEKYQKQVHALAWRKIGDFHIAEEITQDTFLKAYMQLTTLKDPQSFAGWLYVIAANRCTSWLRKKRICTQSLEDLDQTDTEQLEKEAYSEYVVEENERVSGQAQREVVKKLLAKLGESERTVMTLHYFGEMSCSEIGAFLGVSANTVKSRLHRAQQRLKKEETVIREALDHFKVTPNLTENIMREVSRIKPAAPPSSGKPIVPWAVASSTLAVVLFMLGFGNSRYLQMFQKPYSLDATAEMTVDIIEAPIAMNLESKPDVRTQIESANARSKINNPEQQTNDVAALSEEAQADATVEDWTKWKLPVGAKARLGKGAINEIAYSPDGTKLAVASAIGIWFYNPQTGEELDLFTGHTGQVYSIAFSPDGTTIISGSDDKTLGLWDVNTGERLQTLSGHTDTVYQVRFGSDGKTIVSGSADETLRLWNVETGKHLQTLSDHTGWIESIAFSPDGNMIVSTSSDNTIRLWDVNTSEHLRTLSTEHTNWIYSVAFSPDGKTIVSASDDIIEGKTICLWHAHTGERLRTLSGHTDSVQSVAFSPTGHIIASASQDGTIRLWHVNTGEHLRTLSGHTDRVFNVVFNPDGSTIASASHDGTICLWDIRTGENIRTLSEHISGVYSIAFSPDGSTIAGVGAGSNIRLWNVHTNENFRTLSGGHVHAFYGAHGASINSVAFSPDGKTIVSGSNDRNYTICLWNADTGENIRTFSTEHTSWIYHIAVSPDGNSIISASADNTLRLWDMKTGKHTRTLTGHTDTVNCVVFTPDGYMIVSASDDNTLRLWDMKTGKHTRTLTGHTDTVNCVAIRPDGKSIVSASNQMRRI